MTSIDQAPAAATAHSPASGAPLLELDSVACEYKLDGGGRFRAVNGVSLQLGRSEVLGLVGESGCGKVDSGQTHLRVGEAGRGPSPSTVIRSERSG
jgi:ABC-type glutathione transport system ATPase component